MSEHVYDNRIFPVLAMEVRNGQGEMEERGEREERTVYTGINVSADGPDPGTQQHTVQRNTAQEQCGVSDETKKKLSGLFLVLLFVLLLAVIIGLVINNKEKNNLIKVRDRFQSSFDQLEMRYNNLTKETEDLTRIICESWGWKPFARGCYNISFGAKSWQQSRQYCKDREGDLMVINSKEKQDFVNNLNLRVWLGLTDTEKEGTFVWVDNTSLTTPTYWQTDPPNNNGEKNCVEFISQISDPHTGNYRVRGWHVRPCDEDNDHCICERVIN